MRSSIWRNFDYSLFIVTYALIFFGVMMIASATNGAIAPELISRVPNQIQYAIIGTFVMFLLTFIDYRILGAMHLWIYGSLIGMLVMVFLFGQVGDGGARRWINVGILIQPSELGKVLIIITLAYFLSRRYEQMDKISTIIGSLLHVAIPIALIFLQPDLGTTIVYIVLWATLIWAAGLRIKHIGLFFLLFTLLLPVIWGGMASYQRERITNFITAESGEQEERIGSRYNIRQARISIGSGGLLGKGYMNGTQTQYRFLRVRHTDFIFSVVAEEFGMVGGLAVMAGIGFVIVRILHGARVASDPLGSMICYGVASMIFFQTVVSIGMNLGLLPITGLTLPFISSGGTSLLSTMAGIGLAQSVIIRQRRFA
ncbi:MAG: rod shape-determining protein RodA [Anaerolineaceae bacterium]|nr:MAG: rod shape-determining protein RodA [Anaerolineaceae bacterium]